MTTDHNDRMLQELERSIGYGFSSRLIVTEALTHPSHCNEQGDGTLAGHYQRLEFLGDSILGMLLAEMLFERYPDYDEGRLSRARSLLAGQGALAEAARLLGLGRLVRLGRGEERTGGRDKDSILADVFEALVAAVYLDGGIEPARMLVRRVLGPLLEDQGLTARFGDAKSLLQELLSERGLAAPVYDCIEVSGPSHDPQFRFQVLVGGVVAGEAEGKSKKLAQQTAALQALDFLKRGAADTVP